MVLTNDMYIGLDKLGHWYKSGNNMFFEIAGAAGTGVWQTIQHFINDYSLDQREVMYLSYDQKTVLELAAKGYRSFYLNGIIYKYIREVNIDSLYVGGGKGEVEEDWVRIVRKKIDPKFRLIVVLDSVLCSRQTLADIASFGLPVLLCNDPAIMPETSSFVREPDVLLYELQEELIKNPVTYMAVKVLLGKKPSYGVYGNVSVIPRDELNLYNLKSSDMCITLSAELADLLNSIYREKVVRRDTTVIGERLVVTHGLPNKKLVNENESRIKVYLTKGVVGYVTKCYKHRPTTKYVPIEFRPDFYHQSFTDMSLDRFYLEGLSLPSRQVEPDEILKAKYAYALPIELARISHWDKLTVIGENLDDEIHRRMLYTAIIKAGESLTLII